ncbi:MAG TPA: NADH-quinone oxidoreductase subunit N [Opitutaceae bacterium]
MTRADFIALLPLCIQAASVLVLLGAVCVRRSHRASMVLSVLFGGLALATLPVAADQAPHAVGPLLIIDRVALFYMGLIFASTIAVAVLSYDYLERHGVRREEFYILLQAATTGAAVLAATIHFAIVFLGLELLSISLYGMIAYIFNRPHSLEAAVKYLILAATASAFLLFGMALIYAESGAMTFAGIRILPETADGAPAIFILGGTALFLTGIGFKLALVPFHLWTPDIYQGAPVPVAAFLAAVSKGAVVSLLLRFALATDLATATSLQVVVGTLAIASMLAGNLLGLLQRNLSRLLAYSSIAHLGYVLVALLAGGAAGAEAVTFYVTSYLVAVLGAFAVISLLSTSARDGNELDDYRGLFWRRPVLAALFTAILLSLAGIPLTAGFLGKFIVLNAGVTASLWPLVLVLVAGSSIGLFYYLRVVATLFAPVSASERFPSGGSHFSISRAGSALLTVVGAVVLGLGVYPGPLVALIRALWNGAP